MKINDLKDTIIAPISSAVGGSVALLRISGDQAIAVADAFFPEKNLKAASGGRFFFGKLLNEKGDKIDEIVLLVYKAPHSFTGEDVIEMSFHANPLIVDRALRLFIKAGCRPAEPGEFSKRAFLNGKIDLIQAEAVADLIAARSQAAVNNSLMQLSGTFSSMIEQLKETLIKTAGLLELELDFSEQGLQIIAPQTIAKNIAQLIKKIERLINSQQTGRLLSEGIKVLITGKPNVGKSSLMNAFLDKNRVIVSETPGTTRDIVHEEIYIKNILVRFIDSAGIHLTDNVLEAEGIERARDYFEAADLIILVVDISEPLTKEDENLLKSVTRFYKEKLVIAGNKSDLGESPENKIFLSKQDRPVYKISAKKGTNTEELKRAIPDFLTDKDNLFPEEIFISNQRQMAILQQTKKALLAASAGLSEGRGYEFIAVDIREAIGVLSGLTGEITTDDILNTIFSSFCIGK